MRKSFNIFVMATAGIVSCGQSDKSTPDTVRIELDTVKPIQEAKRNDSRTTLHINKYIDTENEYSDSTENSLIIQNSLPKGGNKYTDPKGKDFVYAVFWTRITNDTNYPVEFTINFPADSFKIPSSSDNYFKLLVPPDTMTIEKESLYNYGLTQLESILDKNHNKPSYLQRTIKSKEFYSFYIVTLFKTGAEGVVRAGFSIKGQDLLYRVNNKEIHGGKIFFKM